MKRTVVIGASPNPSRYSHRATVELYNNGHEVYPVGLRPGSIAGIEIITDLPEIFEVHTVTLYVGPQNQAAYLEYIKRLSPVRLILNPGTENDEIKVFAEREGIKVECACTLVMLSIGNY